MRHLVSHNIIRACRRAGAAVFAALALAALVSCGSLPFDYSRARSWTSGKEIAGTVRILGTSVDRGGGWDSVERELAALVPLVLGEAGYRLAAENERADFVLDIKAREREYSSDWRTRRSLSMELRIWTEEPGASYEQRLPLAAGQVISTGNASLSSSETLSRMLQQAVKKALKALPREGGA
jgi:hypothetical protein